MSYSHVRIRTIEQTDKHWDIGNCWAVTLNIKPEVAFSMLASEAILKANVKPMNIISVVEATLADLQSESNNERKLIEIYQMK